MRRALASTDSHAHAQAAVETGTHAELRAHGRRWAMHVMEAPITWIMVFLYAKAA